MKALFLCYTDIPGTTGEGTRVYNLAKGLVDSGVDVIILTNIKASNLKLTRSDINGIKVVRCQSPLGYLHSLCVLIQIILSLRLICKEDVTVVQSENIHTSLVGLILKKILKVKLIVDMHGPWIEELEIEGGLGDMRTLHGFARHMVARVQNGADALLIPDEAILETGNLQLPNVHIVPNGADLDVFNASCGFEGIHDEYQLEGGRTILMVTGWEPWTDFDTLIAAAEIAVRRLPRIRFLLVGGSKEQCEALCLNLERKGLAPYFRITGQVPYREVPRFIAASDLCLALYTQIPGNGSIVRSMKIYEYAAMGKPVIASRHGKIPSGFKRNIYLVNPKNPQDLANRIFEVIHSNGGRYDYPDQFLHQYSWKKISQELITIYNGS